GLRRIWDITGRDLRVGEDARACRSGQQICARLGNMPNLTEVHSRSRERSRFELPAEIRDEEIPGWLGLRVRLDRGRLKDNDWARRQRAEPSRRSWWKRLWFSPMRMEKFVEKPTGQLSVPAFPDERSRRGTRGIRWRFRVKGNQLTL